MGEKEETVLSDEFKEGLGDADLEEEVTIDEDLDDDDEGKKEEVVDEDESEEEAAAYNSDFKYRVKDREFEVDDFLRSIITDEATEKQVVDLLTKAKGLEDTVKSRDKLREENETTGKMYKNTSINLLLQLVFMMMEKKKKHYYLYFPKRIYCVLQCS